MFVTESDDKTFYGDWIKIALEHAEQITEAQSVGEDSIELERQEVMSVENAQQQNKKQQTKERSYRRGI